MEGVEKERDKKEGHSLSSDESERERRRRRRGGILKGSQGQSAKVKERHRNGPVDQWKKQWKETMCTSDLGENPADDAMGIPTGSFLPLVPLFSTSDSESELSSMGLLSLFRLRRINPPVPPQLQTQSPTGQLLTLTRQDGEK